MCPVERARSVGLSSVRPNSWTKVHVVLVPPLLVPPLLVLPLFRRCFVFMRWFRPCFVFRRWYRWCNVKRIAFVIFWIVLGSFVFASCGGYKKLGILPGPATALSSRRFFSRFFLQHRRHTSALRLSDGYFTSQWSWTRSSYKTHFHCSGHNWQLCIDQYSQRYFLIITEYLIKIRIKSPQPRGLVVMCILRLKFQLFLTGQSQRARRLGSTTSNNAATQQAQGGAT